VAGKTVRIHGNQGNRFRMDVTAGNHKLVVDQSMPQGEDLGPNPLEYCLVSLAGCIGAIGRIIASQRKLDVRGFGVVVEGELDTDNLLGISDEKRAGFSRIDVSVDIDADMTPEEKAAFLHEIDARCPISDCLLKGTLINVRTV
jgi:putative redox protein